MDGRTWTKGHVTISVSKSLSVLPSFSNFSRKKSSMPVVVASGLMLYSDPLTISIGGITRCKARAMTDFAVPFPPAITNPPMLGLTAHRIKPVLISSCPITNDNGMSNFVFDSEVICNEGDVMALATASALIPKNVTAGDFMASTDSVPARLSIMTDGDSAGLMALDVPPPLTRTEGELKGFVAPSLTSLLNLMILGESKALVTFTKSGLASVATIDKVAVLPIHLTAVGLKPYELVEYTSNTTRATTDCFAPMMMIVVGTFFVAVGSMAFEE